jgi:bifunctional DNA-binding transcriptional regulator/antitoxin component of YhaV-PrlF toxin-antitoxin module
VSATYTHTRGTSDCASPRRAADPPYPVSLYCYRKGIARISAKNQVTLPVAALAEAGLRSGDRILIESVADGELRIRRAAVTFDSAFGTLTGIYPAGYLERLDAEDRGR